MNLNNEALNLIAGHDELSIHDTLSEFSKKLTNILEKKITEALIMYGLDISKPEDVNRCDLVYRPTTDGSSIKQFRIDDKTVFTFTTQMECDDVVDQNFTTKFSVSFRYSDIFPPN